MDHQGFSPYLIQRFKPRRHHRPGGFPVAVDYQYRQVAQMPAPLGPLMFPGLLRVVMSAGGTGSDGLTLFYRRLAATVSMNVKTMSTRR